MGKENGIMFKVIKKENSKGFIEEIILYGILMVCDVIRLD